jgi:uncharacterized protein
MKFFVGVIALVLLALATPGRGSSDPATPPVVAPATQNTVSPSPEAITLAKRFFVAAHLDAAMHNLIKSLMPMEIDAMSKNMAPKTPEQKAAIIAAAEQAFDEWTPTYFDRVATIYAQVFTLEELRAMVSFYESPIGQSITSKSASLAPVVTQEMQAQLPALTALMRKHLCERLDCRKLDSPAQHTHS